MAETMAETILDLRGLKCPLPVLLTRKALDAAAPGAVLLVQCTDPLAGLDIPNLVRETGDLFEGAEPGDGYLTLRVRRGAGDGMLAAAPARPIPGPDR